MSVEEASCAKVSDGEKSMTHHMKIGDEKEQQLFLSILLVARGCGL
jgi:hypothetical protein